MTTPMIDVQKAVYEKISQIFNPITCEKALSELSEIRFYIHNLGPMLWQSFGITNALLQEIINVYPAIVPPTLTAQQSIRVCNAIDLLQCIASHPETRAAFLWAKIPLNLYPFLLTTCETHPYEYLRLKSIGVIVALVETDEHEVITFLLTTRFIPICLRIMENSSEMIKTIATYIFQKILLEEFGLPFVCRTYDRFSHVALTLGKMIMQMVNAPCPRLLQHIIRCYLRLSDDPRARIALRLCLPSQLRDNTFSNCLHGDNLTKQCQQMLLYNIGLVGVGSYVGRASCVAPRVGPIGSPVGGIGNGVGFVPQQQYLQPQSDDPAQIVSRFNGYNNGFLSH